MSLFFLSIISESFRVALQVKIQIEVMMHRLESFKVEHLHTLFLLNVAKFKVRTNFIAQQRRNFVINIVRHAFKSFENIEKMFTDALLSKVVSNYIPRRLKVYSIVKFVKLFQ